MTRKLTAKTIENLKPGPQRREISDGGSGLWLVLQSSGAKSWAVINVTDNVRGDLSAHVITVSELNRQKIARAIECDGHDAESVGIIDTTDIVRRDHSLYLTVAKDISSPQSENKKRAISHPQMCSTINSTNPIPTSSTASATESYSSQCR